MQVPQQILDEISENGVSRIAVKPSTSPFRVDAEEFGLIFDYKIDRIQLKVARDLLLNDLSMVQGATAVAPLDSMPLVILTIDEDGLEYIQNSIYIDKVYPQVLLETTLTESIPFSGIPTAWTNWETQGEGVSVAVIDSGIDTEHEFFGFGSRVVAQACFSDDTATQRACANFSDMDSFGPGAAEPCQWGFDCGPDFSHGTHVTGIAAGDKPGLHGVAPAAEIIPIAAMNLYNDARCSFLGGTCRRFDTHAILRALDYLNHIRSTYNLRAINMSLGKFGGFAKGCEVDPPASLQIAPEFDEMFGTLRRSGVAFVSSSGNDGEDQPPNLRFPSCVSTAISVGNIDKDGNVNSTSSYDPGIAGGVDIFAPGTDILSSEVGGTYEYRTGASAAAPHVAGAFALMAAEYPTCEISSLLGSLQTTGETVFDERIAADAPRLYLGGPPWPGTCVPAAPDLLQISGPPGSDAVPLSWRDNGFGEDRFEIQALKGSIVDRSYTVPPNTMGVESQDVEHPAADVTEAVADLLSAGTSYSFRVRACRTAYCSPWSNEVSTMTPSLPVPPQPSGLRLAEVTPTSLRREWDPDSSGTATYYSVVWGDYSLVSAQATLGQEMFTAHNLTANRTYVFYLRSCSSNGCGDFAWLVLKQAFPEARSAT